MGWSQATPSDLFLDLPIPDESLPEETECPEDFDLLEEPILNGHWIADTAPVDLVCGGDLPETPAEEAWTDTHCEFFRHKAGLILSTVAHAVALAALLCLSINTSTGGPGDLRERIVSVRLIDGDLSVPQEESPSTMDSAASAASVAERRQQVSTDIVKPSRWKAPERPATTATLREAMSDSLNRARKIEEILQTRPLLHRTAGHDQENLDSPSKADSVNSIPSTANSQRRMLLSAGSEMVDFRTGVLSAIEQSVFFPRGALTKGLFGQSLVRFTICRDGSITGLCCVSSSGSNELDQAALQIIEKASRKFPPFPKHVAEESVSYVVPIVFKARVAGGS